ncbi:MAG: hypothetical protein AAFY36_18820 [Bacteroidota bacterium]
MKGLAEKEPESVFGEFFNKYDLEVINIRNSSTAYYGYLIDTISYDYSDVNLIAERRQIGNILSATASGGLSALPNYYHQVLRDHTVRSAICIEDYKTINLPYLLADTRPLHEALNGQIFDESCKLQKIVTNNNLIIQNSLDNNIKGVKILPPPLGRRILWHTREYMIDMLSHEDVKRQIDRINAQ